MTQVRARVGTRRRLIRLILAAILVTLGIAASLVLPATLGALLPRPVIREATSIFLRTCLVVYLAGLAVALPASLALAASIVRSRRRGARVSGKARVLLACVSFLIGALMLEGMATAWLARARGFAPVVVRPSALVKPGPGASEDLSIVVIGESSSIGAPYEPWASIGQIVGWQIERAFPGRKVAVDIRGRGGFDLRQAVQGLDGIARRPDAVLLYSGHNEYQAFYRLSREVGYYADRASPPIRPDAILRSISRLGDLILETIDRQSVDAPPPPSTERRLVDAPAFTEQERARIVADFRARLELVYGYCERVGAVPIVFVPAGNDAGFDPSRSMMDPSATPADRAAFAAAFRDAEAIAGQDPKQGETAFRALVARQPGFAEAHYRLARILERSGAYEEANRHYVQAREHDGLPLRCTADIQSVIREVGSRHDGILIEVADVLRPLSTHGILDNRLFHDAHHPNLASYTAIARAVLERLRERRALGWPADRPAPLLEVGEVARQFGIDAGRWGEVCRRTESWYKAVAPIRFDPSSRLVRARDYARAAARIAGGTPPDRAGMPGVGVPEGATPSEHRVDERGDAGARQGHKDPERADHQQDRQ